MLGSGLRYFKFVAHCMRLLDTVARVPSYDLEDANQALGIIWTVTPNNGISLLSG